jgi:hypothetical protein
MCEHCKAAAEKILDLQSDLDGARYDLVDAMRECDAYADEIADQAARLERLPWVYAVEGLLALGMVLAFLAWMMTR